MFVCRPSVLGSCSFVVLYGSCGYCGNGCELSFEAGSWPNVTPSACPFGWGSGTIARGLWVAGTQRTLEARGVGGVDFGVSVRCINNCEKKRQDE